MGGVGQAHIVKRRRSGISDRALMIRMSADVKRSKNTPIFIAPQPEMKMRKGVVRVRTP